MRITKDAQERKKEILNAASELFLQNGFKNTSVDMIVKKVNVAKGLFYYYFESKESVLKNLEDSFMEQFEEGLYKKMEEEKGTFRDKLSGFIGYYLRFIEENFTLITISSQASTGKYPDLVTRLKESAKKSAFRFTKNFTDSGAPKLSYPSETFTVLVSGFSDLYLSGVRDEKIYLTILSDIFGL